MDNAEQSPRGPSKGIFDTASLLVPSSTIFSSQSSSSVQSPLTHLAHSPSAFSVLGRASTLVPPSSNSESSSLPASSKICSPVIHHSASDALSSLASSSSGPCGWWSATTPVATTADFPGCGVASISDHYGRAGMCGRSSVSLGSSAHLQVPQPRRIVEEVLGHLYAKPPSAEVKAEPQSSGIHGSHQASCKTSTASSSLNLATASQKSSSKIKSNASVIGEVNSGKPSEKSKTTLNNVQTLLSVNSSISGNIVSKSSSKKNSIENSESGTEVSSLSQINSTSRSKKHINDSSSKNVSSKNGKNKGNSKSKAQANSKPKEKTAKRFSSDSESHSDSSCTSTGSDSGSSGGVSSSASSESSDDEEREKQQKQLAKLKKQQMELRRKVQELKQASQESTHPKADIHVKRTPSKCSGTPSNSSKATKPVPTPAHSASATSVSPSAASPKSSKTMLSSPGEEDVNMSVPLDLCIKKQEPTFEVANTSVNNSYTSPTSIVKKQVPTSSIQSPNMKLQAGVKKRGRKPKFALSSSNNIMDADAKSHNLKQNPVKELGGLQIISLSSDSAANSDITIHHKKTTNSIVTASKPVSLLAARVADSVSTPRKNFTLDSLLSESNGTIDVISSQVDDMEMLPSSSFSSKVSKNKERLRYSSRIKKMEAKNKEIETKIRRETSSGTDSDVENDNSDTDDTEKSASGSIISNVPTSTSGHGHKRSYDEDGDDSPTKRKRILPDEKDIQIPLEHGWRRQTKIRCFSRSGVRGEVTYYAPCGKKLRNYPEVVRYLIKHGITDITRENFSFSTKINVGEFLESTSSGAGEDYVLLSEQEVIARIDEVRARKGRLGVQVRKTPQQRSAEEEEQQRQWEQKQLQHQLEQQELTRQAQELKMMRKMEKEQALMAAKEEKKLKAEEARRQKEHQRLLKQQERFERLEQLRIEREIRAQQLIEEQEMKRQQAVFLREQEMQKRREMLLMVDLERERRRQHMMLVRALEARKKQEERERKREEILYEKRLNKEKKMEQRRMELDYLRELKKPVEDMTLKDTTPLPTLNRIPGVKLSGKAFADTLMVFEFLHNFGETLGFDMESLPSLNTMQMALLNLEEKCEEELLSVIHHLLVCVIEDPGVPNCPEATTVLGQSLKDADITNNNVSEILRLYFIAQDKGSKLCQCLQEKPFLSLSPSQKAEILSYLCNELLCSRLLVRQIDNNIETVNTLRKDKWIVEGDLRKLKTIQQRRALKLKQTANEESKLEQPPGDNTISEVSDSGVTNDFSKENQPSEKGEDDCGEKDSCNKSEKEKFEELENDVANESGNESDDTQATGQVSDGEDEEPHLSNEELSKKIDKLTKQLNSFSAKLVRACHTLRGVTFGQDRYHRRYWVLPKSGGIFVEGMESSELPQEQEKIFLVSPDEQPCNIEKETKNSTLLNANVEKTPVKQESENRGDEIEIQKCIPDEQKQPNNLKSELDDTLPLSKETAEVKEKEQSDSVEKKSESEKEDSEKTNEKKTEGKPSVNIFMPKFCDNSIREEANTPTNSTGHNTDKKQSTNPSIPGDQNWLLHSPFFASLLAGNMLFNGPMMPGREVNGTYFNLPKNDSNNPFGPFLGLPSGMLSAEQIFKSLGEKQSNQKPWFSILPRMPCDENSLIHTQLSKSSITSSAHSPGNLGMPNTPSPSKSTSHTSHSTPVSASSGHMAAALANLQMELLNGLPPGFFLHPYLPHQFGPTYQNGPPATNSSHQSSFTSTLSHTSPSTDFNLNLSHPPASSTPSSIPTPSATPGPTSQGSATPSLRDSPSPSFAKRLVIDRMSQEHERPKPVPLELRKGWWRITDSGQLKTLLSALHHRGIREKMLQKQIQKHFNYACTACSQGQQDATDLDITDLDRQISQLPGGAPVAESEAWSREVALRVDLAILEQVENLEEKVGGASMQVKGWKPPLKMSSDSTVAFFPACEQYLQEKNCSKTKQLQNSIQSIALNNKNLVDENCKSTSQSKVNNSINTTVETVELDNKDGSIKCEKSTSDISDDIEDIKDDVCEKDESMDLEEEDFCESEASGNINPVEEAKKRLLMVEAAIERRYLRPPLGTSTNELNLSTMSNSGTNNNQTISEAGDEVHVPVGLLKWRDAVKACKTSSQLAMCLNFLESCTAWDKSIMRASCQFCHSGDNEDMLLLCDGCDKGYHTYCFKPKMEAIPEGDWYCYECLNKATGDKVCVICGKKGKLLECETCPKTFHLTCLEPPLSKMPKGKWYCSGCSHNKPKKSSKKNSNSKDKDNSKEQKDSSGSNKKSENSQSSKSKSSEKKEKKDRNQVNKDLAPCSSMVDELEKHDDAWPFLMPVNTKQFPTYRKVIKKPMDFNTIRSKLESGLYKSREDFVGDVRLIFDNCETFNEDDSPVGQAGHTLRAFFETRWSELCAT